MVVFLRGGMDHLSAVFPLDDRDLHDARPTIAVPDDAALLLGDGFGLHPAMPQLHRLHGEGRLATVVAAGNPAGDRSHFVAQDLAALGATEQAGDGRGWLARHLLDTATADETPLRAITIGANVDRSLAGYPAIGMASIQQFGLAGRGTERDGLVAVLREAYDGRGAVDDVAAAALDAAAQISELPASANEDPFADAATLLDADLGTEVITVDIGGWDTHDQMGTLEAGRTRNLLSDLDQTLGRFLTDLDARSITDVTTVVMTEFGRRVRENGSGGTDHGAGSVMWVIGGRTVGGVHGDWPGLAPDALDRGDVAVSTDFRDVLAEVADGVLAADPAVAFPDHDHRSLGLLAPA